MSKKNNIIFYEPSRRTQEPYGIEKYHPAVFVVAGGRARVPVVLLWLTWSLILAVLILVETGIGMATGEFSWDLPVYWVVGLIAVFVIYWPIKFVWYVLSWWVRIIRGAL